MNVILAIDIGSSSVRCSAYSAHDTNVTAIESCSSSIGVSTVVPNSGKIKLYHHDGTGTLTLMDVVDKCVNDTIEKLRKHTSIFRIIGVGFSCFVMNLIAIDEGGNFVSEEATISYACNSSTVANECQQMRKSLGSDGMTYLYQNTGTPIHSSYAIPQLRALYCSKTSPPSDTTTTRQIWKWQSIASLCLCQWTGKKSLPISYSEASWTGLLNFRECNYEKSAIDLIPEECKDALPELADATEPILRGIPEYTPNSNKTNKYWSQWPELRDASLFLGIGDGACANVGSKAVTDSRIAVTVGTSAAARICLNLRVGSNSSLHIPKGLFCYRIDKSHVLVGGALTDGGSVIEWARDFLNLSTNEAFQECIKEVKDLSNDDYIIGSNSGGSSNSSLTMIPFLSGERSTGFRVGATGAVVGLTRSTKPAHLLKSCLESVALRLRAVLELIIEARGGNNGCLPMIVASGKALESNELWRQMIADSSGLKVVLDEETYEGTSRGVARLVAIALVETRKRKRGEERISGSLKEEEIHAVSTVEPRANAKAYFDQLASTQEKFISAMSPMYA